MGQVLGIVYRCIATHLIKKAGFSCTAARTGAVTLIQRFGSALNLNLHFHMIFFGWCLCRCRQWIEHAVSLGEGADEC